MPRRASLIVFLGLVIALVFVTGISAGAEPDGGVPSKEAEIVAAQDRLMEIRVNVSTAQAAYDNALFEMNHLNGQITRATEDLEAAEERLAEAQKDLEERASQVYRSGNVAFMDVLVGVDNFSEFASRLDLWMRLLGQERAEFEAVREAKNELAARKTELEAQREQRVEAVEEAVAQKERATEAEAEAEAYLNSLNADLRDALQARQDRQAELARAAAAAPTPEPAPVQADEPEPIPEVQVSQVEEIPVPQPNLEDEQAAAERAAAAQAAAEEAQLLAEERAAARIAARQAEREAAEEQAAAEAEAARLAREEAQQEAMEEAERQAARAAERAAARQAEREEAERQAARAAERAAIEQAAAEQAAAERAAAERAAEQRAAARIAARQAEREAAAEQAERVAARQAEREAAAEEQAAAADARIAARQAEREAASEEEASASASASPAPNEAAAADASPAPSSASASASAAPAPARGGGASASGGSVIAEGQQYLGTPYVLGGSAQCVPYKAMDCSCFTMTVYSAFGIALPDNPGAQMGYGTPVSGAPVAGDLLFWSENGSGVITHVGIAMGDGTTIHASVFEGMVVQGTPIDAIPGYVGARRLL